MTVVPFFFGAHLSRVSGEQAGVSPSRIANRDEKLSKSTPLPVLRATGPGLEYCRQSSIVSETFQQFYLVLIVRATVA